MILLYATGQFFQCSSFWSAYRNISHLLDVMKWEDKLGAVKRISNPNLLLLRDKWQFLDIYLITFFRENLSQTKNRLYRLVISITDICI